MAFTVISAPDAEQELAELWLATRDREAVALAADQIEMQLRRRPENVGEPRAAGRRILIVAPLVVTYRVVVDDRMVKVLNVHDFHAKNSE